jgi:phosphoglycerate dehydrogenase-like enzyme
VVSPLTVPSVSCYKPFAVRPRKIVVFNSSAAAYHELLAQRFPDLPVAVARTEDALRAEIADAEVLLAWRFPLGVLAHAPNLRWIQLTSAGADHLLPARERLRDVIVTNARGIHADLMADYAMGVMVMLQWNFPGLLREQQARRWRHRFTEPLAGKTLGVVGLGTIGREIVRRARSFDMDVLGVKREPSAVEGVRRMFAPADILDMLPLCDFVVLVVPQTAETRGMLGERAFSVMRPTAYLINIARGSVVDEPALIRALEERRIAGAALDVFATEPLAPESPLWGMGKVIVTPHIAGEPEHYARRVMAILGENVDRWAEGRPLVNVVDLDRGY